MKSRKIEVTQEMLEQALHCCMEDSPAPRGADPCAKCYLQQMNLVAENGHVSTGETCFQHLMLDVIDHIRRINDFEQTSAARLLAENGELERKNAILKKAVEDAIAESYGRPVPQEAIDEFVRDAEEAETNG